MNKFKKIFLFFSDKITKEKLNRMDKELLIEELKHINNIILQNNRVVLSLFIVVISISFYKLKLFNSNNITFDNNIADILIVVSWISVPLLIISIIYKNSCKKYKLEIINLLIKKSSS